MQPAVITAIHDWELAWSRTEKAATHAVTTAFPPLRPSQTPTGCCDVMLDYTYEGLGDGRLCIDNEGRATIEFEDLPNRVVAEAIDEIFGIGWFDGSDGRALTAAGPGIYNWDDETTGAEFEIVLGEDGLCRVFISYARVPDAATVLDALTVAANRCRSSDD
ncbi:hypothetical protein ACFY0Z_30025 [Streptomyces kronopolitis]|uniref:hypothetical protein n=1 Tax=Streptomyces kronopolitis TaxID=1612435 RepID=UPI00368D41F4